MPGTFGIAPLIPGLVNEVVLEIFRHFVTVDRNGPFTLVLVCSAWRDRVLRSKSLQILRRRRRNTALVGSREKAGEGICIVSFDGGGPGSVSQLRMLDEIMLRLAFKMGVNANEICPADYFDLMGGVGFGGLAALLLGRLRMTTMQAMEELATIGTMIFTKEGDMVTPEVNLAKLRNAIESMLERHHHPVDIKLYDGSDSQCKVVLFAAATAVMDHCHPFRTYSAPRRSTECTLVDAACATIATPEYFSPVAIGPQLREQSFAGIPHGFDNPTQEVMKEAQLGFGETSPVSLVLSLGSGQRVRLSSSDHHVTRLSHIHCDSIARHLQFQWGSIVEHLRLNVDKGMEDIKLDDWSTLGTIETHTDVYLAMSPITTYIDKACQWLLQKGGSVTLGQLNGTNTDCVVKVRSESLKDYMAMEFKQMRDVVQQMGIGGVTLVDPIGNDIQIPTAFCLTFPMLLEVIGVYFKHQKVPGSDYVERGDYRLVHGNRKNVVGRIEWTHIKKVGLKVEMSMILRTHNQSSTRCPRCRAGFEGSTMARWAQCLSCSTQFQIETHVQAETPTQFDDTNEPRETNQSGEDLAVESIVSPGVSEADSTTVRNKKHTASSGEAEQLQFRLISVINFLENPDNRTDIQMHDEQVAEGAGRNEEKGNFMTFNVEIRRGPAPDTSTAGSLLLSASARAAKVQKDEKLMQSQIKAMEDEAARQDKTSAEYRKAMSVIAKLNAQFRAAKLMGDHGLLDDASAARRKDPDATDYHAIIPINDYPQKARWKVTNKEIMSQLIEATGASVTTKGIFYERGKGPPIDGPPKIHLLIESDNEFRVEQAVREIKRLLIEACAAATQPDVRRLSQTAGHYRVL